MRNAAVLVCLLSGLFLCAQGQPNLTGYANSREVTSFMINSLGQNTNTYFKLYWNVTATNLFMGVVCQNNATGWCAVGFNPLGVMLGTDAYIGRVNGAAADVVDFTINTRFPPSVAACPSSGGVCPDTSRNCTNNVASGRGSAAGGYLSLEWSRPLVATDACDVAIQVDTDNYVVYSAGPVGGTGPWPFNILQHFAKSAPQSTSIYFSTRPVTTGTTGVGTTGAVATATTTSATTTSTSSPATTTTTATSAATTTTTSTSATTTTTTSTSGNPPTSTTGVVTGGGCDQLDADCKRICGNAGIVRCLCQHGAPSAECGMGSSIVASVALLVAMVSLFFI